MTTSTQETKQDWYFTFGCGQEHSNKYVKIHGTFSEARAEMYSRFGTKWSMQYESAEEAGIKQWGYEELK